MKTYAFVFVLCVWPLVSHAQESQPTTAEPATLDASHALEQAAAQPTAAETSEAPSQVILGQAADHASDQTRPAPDALPPDFWAAAESEQPAEQRTYLGALYATPEHEGLQGVQVLSVIPGSPAARAGFIGANTPQQQGTNWFRVAVLALSMSPAGAFAIPLTIAHHVYTNRHAPADLPGDLIVALDDTPFPTPRLFPESWAPTNPATGSPSPLSGPENPCRSPSPSSPSRSEPGSPSRPRRQLPFLPS